MLEVSQGPEPVAVPEIVGVDEATAKANLDDAGLVYDDELSSTQFSDTVAAGIVISASGKDDAGAVIPLANGASYFDQRPVGLVVSLGQLPAIAGMSLEQAIAALKEVDVIGIEGSRTFDDTIPVDAVIRAEPQNAGDPIRPNDTVLIVISKGVDLVEIPDIIGRSVNDAGQRLRDAGFVVNTDGVDVNKAFWDVAEVQSFSPGEVGGSLKRGTTIKIFSHYD